ncbi:hypothetical protein GR160_08170 [Flavobacterium sp. Sd200]|uniref:hypothetical protein n=1 Tax=Flavobacterium sp. Sd200 TaxID=2692211 RepID=UPI00136D32CB|nr:hypothetical protein [Flavobacterium sp. Sd200]MXN91202.1 hypothetical protein [Flavobacterium sp. Sd200]
MSFNKLQLLADEICNMPICEAEKEELLMQAAGLIRFAECYDKEIIIKEHRGVLSIIGHKSNNSGVVLFDARHAGALMPIPAVNIQAIKQAKEVKEFWFVYIADYKEHVQQKVRDFIDANNLRTVYDRLFVFDFFKATIHTL